MEYLPLMQMNIEEAKQMQFRIVDEVTKVFKGDEVLNLGDLGVVQPGNKPKQTEKVEKVIANIFQAEKAILVMGAGTGAIRFSLQSVCSSGKSILVHTASIYPTTKVTLEGLGAKLIKVDFNDLGAVEKAVKTNEIDAMLIQYTRQSLYDHYDIKEVIEKVKSLKDIPIISDDNYAVMKVHEIAVQLGSDISAFSAFKLLGPEGVGIIVGKAKYIDAIQKMNYSGGGQVQGWQAMEVLRGLIYSPIAHAIQSEVCDHVKAELDEMEIKEIKSIKIVNAQSKVLIVEFVEEIATEVLEKAVKFGAAPNPIGAESKYEFVPMFYRISSSASKDFPNGEKRMIRINPMRSGANTVIRILLESIKEVKECF